MKFTLKRKLVAGVGLAGLLVLGGGPVLAETQAQSAQDGFKKLDAAAVAAANPDCRFFSATNAAVQRRAYTNNTPTAYTTTDWVNLQCGSFTVTVPRGKSALAVVKVDGEVTCTNSAAANNQWCEGRVLINGAEGQPSAPEPDSFAWSNSQVDPNAWESNAFTRTAYLRCSPNTREAVCTYFVRAQVKNHASGLNFRLDDTTVDANLTYF
ncbi:MAG TPA: hypothetical protein VMT30_08260 [Candidatus Saccharimonadia bacterium]|nr:hypothetical protein [Candidatus Saccharimonadia bacterium]